MAEALHNYIEQRLRLTLTGSISGEQMDKFIRTRSPTPQTHPSLIPIPACLTHLFKTLRPSATLNDIFIAVSEPSICSAEYCCCKDATCRLDKYKISIFISRREQGMYVTKPWVRASSSAGFEDAVISLMEQADELVAQAEEGKQCSYTDSL
jgi:hypothetical protein